MKLSIQFVKHFIRAQLNEAEGDKPWFEMFYCPKHHEQLEPIWGKNPLADVPKVVDDFSKDREKLKQFKNILPPTKTNPEFREKKTIERSKMAIRALICPLTEEPGDYDGRACDYVVTARKANANQVAKHVAQGAVAREFDLDGMPAPMTGRNPTPRTLVDVIGMMAKKKMAHREKHGLDMDAPLTFSTAELKFLSWEYPNKLVKAKAAAEGKGEAYKGPEPYFVKADAIFRELRRRGFELRGPEGGAVERKVTPPGMNVPSEEDKWASERSPGEAGEPWFAGLEDDEPEEPKNKEPETFEVPDDEDNWTS